MNPFFRQLTILWASLTFSPILMLSVFVFVAQEQTPNADLKGIFDLIAPIFVISSIGISQFIYAQLIQKLKTAENQDLKMQAYQSANIIKWALIESSSIFCAVAYFLTQTQWLIALVLGITFWMFLQRPTPEKYKSEVE